MGALELARELAAEEPDNLVVQSALASVELLNGNLDTAEAIYEGILEINPRRTEIWLELSRLKARQGDSDGASAVIDRGLAAAPEDPAMLWAQASTFERNGDIDGAIEIYEALYARNSNSTVVANNLASLLSTHRNDADSLERAWTIARRLREEELPAFKDTYGWIAHRRGNSEEAVPYLEDAARGLPRQPLVHYHLAEAYRAVGRIEDALTAYRLALTTASPADTRPQIEAARNAIPELEAELAATAEDAPTASE